MKHRRTAFSFNPQFKILVLIVMQICPFQFQTLCMSKKKLLTIWMLNAPRLTS